MKKLVWLFLLLVCSAAYAKAPFGLLTNVENPGDSSPARLLRKIISGERICVQVDNSLEPGNNAPYLEMIKKGYNEWFSHTLKAIEDAGRQEEFADLLPYLKQGVQVKEAGVDCSGADLVVYVQSLREVRANCKGPAISCVLMLQDPMLMFFYPFEGVKSWLVGGKQNIISHELGHTLGMADQYKYGRNNSHEIYHTPDIKQSIMREGSPLTKFGCDDVDGFINLLDVSVFFNHRGGKQGWRSFCKSRSYSYVNGRPVVNAKYVVNLLSNGGKKASLNVFNPKGELAYKKEFSFENSRQPYKLDIPFQAVRSEKDKDGRVIYESNARGEKRFCSYTYERTSCIIIKGDNILLEYMKVLKRKNIQQTLIRYYGTDGKLAVINFEKFNKEGRLSFSNGKDEKVFWVSGRGKVSERKNSASPSTAVALTAAFGTNLQHRAEQQKQKAEEKYFQRVYDFYLK